MFSTNLSVIYRTVDFETGGCRESVASALCLTRQGFYVRGLQFAGIEVQ